MKPHSLRLLSPDPIPDEELEASVDASSNEGSGDLDREECDEAIEPSVGA